MRREERLEERADERRSRRGVAVEDGGCERGGGRGRSLRGGARFHVLAPASPACGGLDRVAVFVALDGLGEE